MFEHKFLGQVPIAGGPQSVASRGRQWWMHHIFNTRALAEAAMAGDVDGALAAIGELWAAVLDWQKITGSPVAGVLMGEHTVLAKLLVECLSHRLGDSCAQTAVAALMRNVDSQAQLFPRQPEEFASLFGPHTELAGAYITDLAQGDKAAFQEHFAQAVKNGELLGEFTDRVFP